MCNFFKQNFIPTHKATDLFDSNIKLFEYFLYFKCGIENKYYISIFS